MFNKICSTWAACSGVSTPTLTWSVRMTLILGAVFQRAQLFQGFRLFQGGGFPAHVVFKEVPAVGVNAQMAQRGGDAGMAGIGNDGTGEVQGVAVAGQDHFDDVRVVQVFLAR